MTSPKVEAINLNSLHAAEAAAIRDAEAEAEAFYGNIEAEETERVRLADTRTVCNLMWHNRHNAVEVVSEYLDNNETVFTEEEKETLIRVAQDIHPENMNHREARKALEFVTTTARLYRTMQGGYYFKNFPATRLFQRYTK